VTEVELLARPSYGDRQTDRQTVCSHGVNSHGPCTGRPARARLTTGQEGAVKLRPIPVSSCYID